MEVHHDCLPAGTLHRQHQINTIFNRKMAHKNANTLMRCTRKVILDHAQFAQALRGVRLGLPFTFNGWVGDDNVHSFLPMQTLFQHQVLHLVRNSE